MGTRLSMPHPVTRTDVASLDLRVPSRRSIMFAFCSRRTLPTTSEALPDFPERASDMVLYLVAGAGFEPATFGL